MTILTEIATQAVAMNDFYWQKKQLLKFVPHKGVFLHKQDLGQGYSSRNTLPLIHNELQNKYSRYKKNI